MGQRLGFQGALLEGAEDLLGVRPCGNPRVTGDVLFCGTLEGCLSLPYFPALKRVCAHRLVVPQTQAQGNGGTQERELVTMSLAWQANSWLSLNTVTPPSHAPSPYYTVPSARLADPWHHP